MKLPASAERPYDTVLILPRSSLIDQDGNNACALEAARPDAELAVILAMNPVLKRVVKAVAHPGEEDGIIWHSADQERANIAVDSRSGGSRMFEHPDTDWFLEFPPGPLGFGDTYVEAADLPILYTVVWAFANNYAHSECGRQIGVILVSRRSTDMGSSN